VRRVRVVVLSGDFANGHMNRVLEGDDSWGKMFSQALIDMMARGGGAMAILRHVRCRVNSLSNRNWGI
jgi:hypothetical protein